MTKFAVNTGVFEDPRPNHHTTVICCPWGRANHFSELNRGRDIDHAACVAGTAAVWEGTEGRRDGKARIIAVN
jgi:hypothetical protein